MPRIRRRHLRNGLIVAGVLFGAPQGAGAVLGLACMILGSALHLWSKGCLRQNRALCRGGPYRLTRNPFYLANLLIDVGLCAWIGAWWIALPYLALWAHVYGETIAREEEALLALFGGDYRTYAAQVPRLLPWPGRTAAHLAPDETPRFSWKNPNLARGGEYARMVGFAVAPVLVWIGAEVRAAGSAGLSIDAFRAASPGLALAILLVGLLQATKVVLVKHFKKGRPILFWRDAA